MGQRSCRDDLIGSERRIDRVTREQVDEVAQGCERSPQDVGRLSLINHLLVAQQLDREGRHRLSPCLLVSGDGMPGAEQEGTVYAEGRYSIGCGERPSWKDRVHDLEPMGNG